MNKSELIREIAKERGLPERKVKEVVDLMFEVITEALENGERIEIRGLGSFKIKRRPSRFVRDPKTGIEMFVKEKFVPHFKMGKQIKQELNPKK